MSHPCDYGMCDDSDCDDCLSTPVSEAEEKARERGGEQYAKEYHLLSPSFQLTDKHQHTNNTFINRYLENRTLRIPKI